ncbi:putative Ctr copper transporter [Acrodontium crateriforme]|uniref:Copper transport protein n=1 Tax=Acrodontium crateriforme TaxID=150365 RepID=A0AAQ3MCF4_9PEZI|nr:putative Ctr copper transporter [Acrodontium crateriforme]
MDMSTASSTTAAIMSSMTSMTGMSSMVSMTTSTATSSSTAMSMGDMDMGGGTGEHACKISMLWNWDTVDSCFISSTWHVRSTGVFAASCIGVILLVMVLEGLRRVSREYDAALVRGRSRRQSVPTTQTLEAGDSGSEGAKDNVVTQVSTQPKWAKGSFRPTFLEQTIRALLHVSQFAVAYFIMLLAMYFNGYIIICILIGAFLGAFVFSWHNMSLLGSEEREITFCCG